MVLVGVGTVHLSALRPYTGSAAYAPYAVGKGIVGYTGVQYHLRIVAGAQGCKVRPCG